MTVMAPKYAQEGQEDRCAACGRVIEFRVIGHTLDERSFLRWVAIRKTKNAPRPIDCPKGGYHAPPTHTYEGTPR